MFDYDHNTGFLHWKIKRKGTKGISSTAGHVSRYGYLIVTINGECFKQHRLVWVYVTGKEPVEQIDHVNGNRADNRFENLRECTHQQNILNTPGWRKKCTPKGVRKEKNCKSSYNARFMHNGIEFNVGNFPTESEAVAALTIAREKKHGNFANNGLR